jgi:two-component system sensor histidine kinase KdpD
VRNFFRKGNLIALRELALRRTADRVDAQMREYRADQFDRADLAGARAACSCVSVLARRAPMLVRAAARLAASLKADWLAVYVETPASCSVCLMRCASARSTRSNSPSELGAETVTLDGRRCCPDADRLRADAQCRRSSWLARRRRTA